MCVILVFVLVFFLHEEYLEMLDLADGHGFIKGFKTYLEDGWNTVCLDLTECLELRIYCREVDGLVWQCFLSQHD